MRRWLLVFSSLALLGALARPAGAAEPTSAQIVAGRFVVVPGSPEVWFVHPVLQTRERVATWDDLVRVASRSGATIPLATFVRVPADAQPVTGTAAMARRLRGRLALDVTSGNLWYVSPKDGRRHFLRTATQAKTVFQSQRYAVSAATLAKLPVADDDSPGDDKLRRRLAGRVLWSVSDGSLWYLSPRDRRRYPLNTVADIQAVFAGQALGVRPHNLAAVAVSTDPLHPSQSVARTYAGQFLRPSTDPDQLWYVSPRSKRRQLMTAETLAASLAAERTAITARGLASIAMLGEADYEERSMTTDTGTFDVQIVASDLSLPGLAIFTLGGDLDTCIDACLAQSVGAFAAAVSGIAAINGGYFCPASDADCADKTDSYYGPLLHSVSRNLINADLLGSTPYPLLLWDTDNRPYYLGRASELGSVAAFEASRGVTLRAAIANWPALVEGGVNVVGSQLLDAGQRSTRATRVALAVRGRSVLFVVVQRATVIDLAGVMATLGVDYAINLDGGSSTALWRYGEYRRGPGRNVPNAIVIARTVVG